MFQNKSVNIVLSLLKWKPCTPFSQLFIAPYLCLSELSTDGAGEDNLDDILKFVLFNPADLNNNYFDSLPLENIVTDEEVTTTTNKRGEISEAENTANRKISSSARRGRPRSAPVTGNILTERRNVSKTV